MKRPMSQYRRSSRQCNLELRAGVLQKMSQYRRSSRQCNLLNMIFLQSPKRLNTAEAVDNVITMRKSYTIGY